MSSTPLWTILVVAVTAFLAAVGQLLLKMGSATVDVSVLSWIANWRLVLGVAFHGVGFILMVIALKHGSLSVLYPVLATSYVWVALLSPYYLAETASALRWVGVLLVLAGIGLVVR